ncbi:hypothetical protein F3Y22_tig00111008pilonHSYRG00045 [Hibiscus syriacus]|uniref:Uncharacterized protein n=1 Tax=Hibiscus syriacus TaxID=106335 RepID=A0A6A2Z6U5_HIBSY|nr:uncharacterized protein LOC120149820 [Hibiscus syriacus]XP_039018461.1 uncharacterized protein LOC120149820 [Hibiscus syriacus]KAE8687711.1 hypothetical protein F3Y22_tig00111008pilonHSYRG00045 [Hibiscus syriacus]
MPHWIGAKLRLISRQTSNPWQPRKFRSDAALEAIAKAAEEKVRTVALYNYPSFSGAISALFSHLYHSRLNLSCLILPFSSVEPLRVEDFCFEGQGLDKCYLLDFAGPKGFATMLSQQSMCEVIAFDHRKTVFSQINSSGDLRVTFNLNLEKSSSIAVYEYFSNKLATMMSLDVGVANLLNSEDRGRVENVLKYIEDADLRRWSLPEIKAFMIGIGELRSKLNCITNPYMYEQLLGISSTDLIAKGNLHISSRQIAANKFLDKTFKVRLGRGLYGECLGVRADGNSHLSDEIGKQLSLKSATAGLRPIGAVIYMQRKNLKMCLRSTDITTDTSEVAKAYGGGGCPSSSSFIIRMDEYNEWLAGNL